MRNKVGPSPFSVPLFAFRLVQAGLKDVVVRPLTHLARPPGELYEATHRNWITMVEGMQQTLGEALSDDLGPAALAELAEEREEDLVLEVSTLTVGTVAGLA